MQGRFSGLLLICSCLLSAGGLLAVEPNADIAKLWWPEQRNVWTPIGWKDHFFRFNVIYNGTVMARPYPGKWKEDAKPWDGLGIQLTFTPSDNGQPPPTRQEVYYLHKEPVNGVGKQGWNTNATRVLRTDWPLPAGVVLRKKIFAHVPSAKNTETGIEPLYAWIRLSMQYVDELHAPPVDGLKTITANGKN